MTRAALLLAALSTLTVEACATALEPDAPEGESSAGTSSSSGLAGHAGSSTTGGGNGAAGSAARGGSSNSGAAGTDTGGRSNSGGSSSIGGLANGGVAGTTANGGANTGGTSNSGSNAGGSASGGTSNGGSNAGGTVNQGGGAACDQAAATALTAMSSNTAVKSDACLSIQIPADQTWIKKVTLQPEGATYPLPFTWSNCGTNSSGAFTANYANFVLDSVTSQCPILIKLGGSGTSFNVQWWGG